MKYFTKFIWPIRLVFLCAAIISALGIVWYFHGARFYSHKAAESHILLYLNSQFQTFNNKKYGGGVILKASTPDGCLPNIDPCISMTTVPFSEESGLLHLPDDPKQFSIELLDGFPKRSTQLYVWEFSWVCCNEEKLASGKAYIKGNGVIYAKGDTRSGQEIAFYVH